VIARACLLLVALAVLAACDDYHPPPAPADPDPVPADPLEARIRERAPTEAPYMIRQGEARHFTTSAGSDASYTVIVQSGLCYKVMAQGDDAVGELDLFLYSASGVLVQQDASTGSGAILGTARPICPEDPTEYRVTLRTSGAGEVAAQLYASP
jgi:hypothetical protein